MTMPDALRLQSEMKISNNRMRQMMRSMAGGKITVPSLHSLQQCQTLAAHAFDGLTELRELPRDMRSSCGKTRKKSKRTISYLYVSLCVL